MKKLMALLLALICLFGNAVSESPATQTDLYEIFEDGDWGYIDPDFIQRQVYLELLRHPQYYYGDEITFVAVLVDFRPTDIYTFQWQYSKDKEEWNTIENENGQTYTFTLDHDNCAYWWRVTVFLWE